MNAPPSIVFARELRLADVKPRDPKLLHAVQAWFHDICKDWPDLPQELTLVINANILQDQNISIEQEGEETLPSSENPDTETEQGVSIEQEVGKILPGWALRPKTFFDGSLLDPLTHLYEKLNAECVEQVDIVRRRLYLILFNRLRAALKDKFRIKKKDLSALYLSRETGDTTICQRKCADLARRGRRYQEYADKLGGVGTLLVIPSSESRTRLEVQVPASGDHPAIESLRQKGINHEAGKWNCHHVVDGIFDFFDDETARWLQALDWKPPPEAYVTQRTQERYQSLPGASEALQNPGMPDQAQSHHFGQLDDTNTLRNEYSTQNELLWAGAADYFEPLQDSIIL